MVRDRREMISENEDGEETDPGVNEILSLVSRDPSESFSNSSMRCCFTDPGVCQRSGLLKTHIQRLTEGAN